ncbi:radical SAM protein [Metallosphaera tengchongensis]|uniref:Radical SAM protein n=1 Tax=Metallosphaera tengchongensis TaxID=1532350 RepID=A0A6N0NTM4_9CREN|nr:radical SAM protein [Metallosphaera tengchongensis]QKQ99178.1 radical SAM protein [Metallosphaera tengchongensis]
MIGGFVTRSKFTTLSITGGSCSLNCFYCGAKYISTMEEAISPEKFEKIVTKLHSKGVRGFLISGGFDESGKLPIRPFLPVMRKLRRELNVVFNLHPGLQDKETIMELRDAVDIVDFEFAYSPGAYLSKGVKRERDAYVEVLSNLIEFGPEYIVPHVMLGLPKDTYEDLLEEMKIASQYKPYLLNFLVVTPTPDTPSRVLKVDLNKILPLIQEGSRMMGGKVSLGCMRPFALKEVLDREVVSRGLVERIANPHHKVVKEFSLRLYDACCSLPAHLLGDFKI